MRYSPVGPLIVPASRRPAGSEMVGQPVAGVTRVGVGAGAGAGAGLGAGAALLIVTLPLLPGVEMSSAPQPASVTSMAEAVMSLADRIFFSWRVVCVRQVSDAKVSIVFRYRRHISFTKLQRGW